VVPFAGLFFCALSGLGEVFRAIVAFVGLVWSAVLLVLVALNAAGRFRRGGGRETLGILLTIPGRDQIVAAKWWASWLHVRTGWWFLAWLLLLGMCSGMNPLGVAFVVVAWWVYAAFLTSLGLYFSLISRSTLRAGIWTVVTVLLAVI